jgi:hypothetical protein
VALEGASAVALEEASAVELEEASAVCFGPAEHPAVARANTQVNPAAGLSKVRMDMHLLS